MEMRRTIEQVEQLAAKLRALPAVENKTREISKQEEVRLLAADIPALIRERNWTIQQVAAYLTTEGLADRGSYFEELLAAQQGQQQEAIGEAQGGNHQRHP